MNHYTQTKAPKLVTIDGPAGSGKSTVSRMVAEKLGWLHVNTGAIYRTLALLLSESKATIESERDIQTFIDYLANNYKQDAVTGECYVNDRNVTQLIRMPVISEAASLVAKNEFVRKCLLPVQRALVTNANGAVVDGRDMGTVVFPDAPLKVFLTASPEQRAKRRALELKAQGKEVVFAELVKEIEERDSRDATRDVAPMVPAKDAIVVDSTEMDPMAVVELILRQTKERGLA